MKWRDVLLFTPFLLGVMGCQSIGELPGIDPTDYAYTFYLCDVTQVYPQPVPLVQSSAIEAMRDLGYTDIDCDPKPDVVTIQATTVDGRLARVTIRPRNAMSAMTVKIGPVGDEMAAAALVQRVALNFGALPRTLIPIEPTLSRRLDPVTPRRLVAPRPVVVLPDPEDPLPPAIPEGTSPFAPLEPVPESKPAPRPSTSALRRRVRLA
jgi:hypothetical protein